MPPFVTRPFTPVYLLIPTLVFLAILFNLSFLVYLILAVLGIVFPSRNPRSSNFDFPVLSFLLLGGFSLLIRGFQIPESFRVLQFFGGTLIVVLLLIRTSFPFFYFRLFLIILTFYESLHLLILRSHPSFFLVYFSRLDMDPLQRSKSLFEGFHRLYGPAFNSTVAGTLLGVLCFCWLFDKATFFHGAPKIFLNKYVSFFLFCVCLFLFISCQTGTGLIVFSAGLLFLFARRSLSYFLTTLRGRKAGIAYYTAIFVPVTILSFSIVYHLAPLLFGRLSTEYISFILDHKLTQQSERLASLPLLLFGTTDPSSYILGGDFIILSFVSGLGLLLLIYFLLLTYRLQRQSFASLLYPLVRSSEILLIPFIALTMLLLASLHYGVFFSIYSQLICASFIIPRPSLSRISSLVP